VNAAVPRRNVPRYRLYLLISSRRYFYSAFRNVSGKIAKAAVGRQSIRIVISDILGGPGFLDQIVPLQTLEMLLAQRWISDVSPRNQLLRTLLDGE
jgi:hypothetical protein